MNGIPWWKKRRWEARMQEEFRFHIDQRVRELMEGGQSRADAELQARREFGSLDLAKEECRDQRAFELIDRLARDLRRGARSLRRAPAYSIAAVLTLALGIGANTAIFSALDGVVLKALPYPEGDRLMVIALYSPMLSAIYTSYPDYLDWQRVSQSFEQIAAFSPTTFDLTNPGSAEHVEGYEVSANFFHTLGVRLAAGRSFAPANDRPGGAPAAVISYRLWQARFHGSPSAIGKAMVLNGEGYTISGVLPAGFRFEDQPADVYTPIGRGNPSFRMDRTVHDLLALGRLKTGVTQARAQSEMNAVQERIDALNPATERNLRTWVVALKQELIGDSEGTLLLLLGAVAFVLLIACANVANLLLARSAGRYREFAVRRALGASRGQIVRHLMIESLMLSVTGGCLGLLLAKFGLKAVLAAAPQSVPRMDEIGVSGSVLLFAITVSIAAGILFALAPALKQAGRDVQTGLREGGRGATGRHRGTQRAFAVLQIALALVLLSGAGLLFRTLRNLWAVNPGFQTEQVITFQAGFSPTVTKSASAMRAAYRQLTERVRGIAGVESADLTALVPLGRGDNSGPFWLGPHPPASMAEIPRAIYYPIGPQYPRTMQIPLLRGRFLKDSDDTAAERVVLIDTLLARRYFPEKNPLGQTLTIPHWGRAGAVAARIVGIVGHVEQYGMDGSHGEKPQIYYSFYQLPDEGLPIFRGEVTFVVRTGLPAQSILPEIKRAVRAGGGEEPVYNVHTMRELVTHSMARQRFPMILLGTFAGIAFLLASLGVYGVMAYATAQRTPEIGIRMALGAYREDILKMLLAEGLRLSAAGLVIGTAAALVLTRALPSFSHLLYGVPANDPWTLLAVSACLTLTALLACYLPARRAARVDPISALRHE